MLRLGATRNLDPGRTVFNKILNVLRALSRYRKIYIDSGGLILYNNESVMQAKGRILSDLRIVNAFWNFFLSRLDKIFLQQEVLSPFHFS